MSKHKNKLILKKTLQSVPLHLATFIALVFQKVIAKCNRNVVLKYANINLEFLK